MWTGDVWRGRDGETVMAAAQSRGTATGRNVRVICSQHAATVTKGAGLAANLGCLPRSLSALRLEPAAA